jgi:transglutaminase-like putative cysteine protease
MFRFTLPIKIALVLAGLGLAITYLAFQPGKPPVYDQEKSFRYSFYIENTTNQFIESASFQVFAPLKETPWQREIDLTANKPFTIKEDSLGNRQLSFKLNNIPPFGGVKVSVAAQLALASKANEFDDDKNKYLDQEKYISLNTQVVEKVLKGVERNGEADELSRKLYDWVVQNLDYTGYIAEDRGSEYALTMRKGDCTEYMYAFAALARSAEIPTKAVAGFVVDENKKILSSGDYHNWAEFYDDGVWHIADPQRQQFKTTDVPYVAFRYISDTEDNPVSTSQRFMAFDPRLRVRMN